MTYRGHVQNGVVVLDDPVAIPEGTVVDIEVLLAPQPEASDGGGGTLVERLVSVIGKIEDLPTDFAQQHDHYLHGTPRR
jgi:hypothetical protein